MLLLLVTLDFPLRLVTRDGDFLRRRGRRRLKAGGLSFQTPPVSSSEEVTTTTCSSLEFGCPTAWSPHRFKGNIIVSRLLHQRILTICFLCVCVGGVPIAQHDAISPSPLRQTPNDSENHADKNCMYRGPLNAVLDEAGVA